jgi:hypothetical protein
MIRNSGKKLTEDSLSLNLKCYLNKNDIKNKKYLN